VAAALDRAIADGAAPSSARDLFRELRHRVRVAPPGQKATNVDFDKLLGRIQALRGETVETSCTEQEALAPRHSVARPPGRIDSRARSSMVSSSGVIAPTLTAMSPSPGQTRTAQAGGISPSTKCSISPVAKFRARKPMGGSSASRLSRRAAGPSLGLDRRRFVGTGRLVLAGKTVDGALPAQAGREQGYGHRRQGGVA
jgi:hypothetical protein